MALGQRLEQSLLKAVGGHYGADFQQSAEHNHVEHLRILHLGSLVHGVDAIDVDVIAHGSLGDAEAVVDEDAAGLHLRQELVERRLIEHDGHVIFTEDRR